MAFKKFEPERNEVWKPEKQGDMIEGYFVSSRRVQTVNGVSNLYSIKTDKEVKDVWGTALLDNFFQNIPVGCKVRLTYQGKMKSQKGGRSYHAFTLEYDQEDILKAEEESTVTDKDIEEIFG
ncbi:MAG: hypothetical protein KatS3mg101_1006 [Patescibacteria group bacterium]|nr:MAG: hypothetical protein KatS3mg101_1006 [Patescibacteria group bacterium]